MGTLQRLISRPRRSGNGVALRVLSVLAIAALIAGRGPTLTPLGAAAASSDTVRILIGAASDLDPAVQGDIGSAAISAQLFEGLTAIDAQLQARPALAESWEFRDGGATVVFHLRSGIQFSDGSPIRAQDVVRSWLRIVDPAHPSPLVSLIGDVQGALDYSRGNGQRQAVGIAAEGNDVVVHLTRPATDFPTIVAGPTFAVVPPSLDPNGTGAAIIAPGAGFVGSGGYVLSDLTPQKTTLTANDHYWAGVPAIRTVELVHDIGGRSSVAAFEDGDIDLATVSPFDATWLAYDDTLGPELRRTDGLSLQYYGFDTSKPPFDDVRVRQAFARAVDWRHLVGLASSGTDLPATGMVPRGIPGRSETDFLPAHDPAGARQLLADSGYPGGAGFPETTLLGGGPTDRAFAAEIQRELGITIHIEVQGPGFFDRLATDPPQIFAMGWVADYPGANDFLGILLGSGASNNYGHWSSAAFDGAVAAALSAPDATAARTAFDTAERIVSDEAPTIPLTYDVSWTLARTGLLGAYDNGMGIIRMAGLAWAR
ncbi:MAG TPA: peptide ABC transporter substrate-binding protein [Candidatus Limnocylindrales bacterium]|nr:peptide ABC transporter substrate-binding protein [Candidatus Limnocylindrales bacterium]